MSKEHQKIVSLSDYVSDTDSSTDLQELDALERQVAKYMDSPITMFVDFDEDDPYALDRDDDLTDLLGGGSGEFDVDNPFYD